MSVEKGSAAARPQGGSGLRAAVAAVFAVVALVGIVLCTPAEAMAAEEIYAIFYENNDNSAAAGNKTYTLVIQNGSALDPKYPKPSSDQVIRICGGSSATCQCDSWRASATYGGTTTRATVSPGIAPHSMRSWFKGCIRLAALDLSQLNMRQVASASGMLDDCWVLREVRVGKGVNLKGVLVTEKFNLSQHGPRGAGYAYVDAYWTNTATGRTCRGDQIPSYATATYKLEKRVRGSIAMHDIRIAEAPNLWGDYRYTGRPVSPKISVSGPGCSNCHAGHPLDDRTLREGVDYTVSYKNNIIPGRATIVVTGKGAYSGEIYDNYFIVNDGSYQPGVGAAGSATAKVTPPKGTSVKKLKKAKRGFTVAWKKPGKAALKQTTGYQVRWSLKKSMKGAKTKTVKATTSAGKKCTLKVSKLKGGKKYYVQVRTYKKASGKTYYSGWSKAKAVKTKK
ncbi:fibronectin type III domain-containing protein [Adlercreutzia caecimuris]|uniref:fibronectin type III domain-containing protein n=1 Tax=Adlercreutzia caecimuris TaxID=671266 RepID=UPI0025706D53|nr:fibronectin type III domain-containing protein [Adlercreutzia caecimuris]